MKYYNERPHKKLDLWRKAIEMVVSVYAATKAFPREEIYGLTAQMRRAAISVSSNIAEGLTRRSVADKLHFLNISQASCSELDTQAEIALKLGFFDQATFEATQEDLINVQRLLGGVIRSVKNKK